MRILFTGASSFTGFWFVQKLVAAGHHVVAPIRCLLEEYDGLRKARIEKLLSIADLRFGISYGSKSFQNLMECENFDLLCHHAAEVTDYKSPDFDYIAALKNNVGNILEILPAFKKVVLTGSVFEQNEGAGSDDLRAVSPYGLSKGLTSDVFQYFCKIHAVPFSKFVIPNPFGPFEEFRFTSFLIQNWIENKSVHVSCPSYVRDNVPVTCLADAYVGFIESDRLKLNPSGYVGSQGEFTKLFAENMKKRLNLSCEFTLANQTEFLEPIERINTDPIVFENEEKVWDELAEYYEKVFIK